MDLSIPTSAPPPSGNTAPWGPGRNRTVFRSKCLPKPHRNDLLTSTASFLAFRNLPIFDPPEASKSSIFIKVIKFEVFEVSRWKVYFGLSFCSIGGALGRALLRSLGSLLGTFRRRSGASGRLWAPLGRLWAPLGYICPFFGRFFLPGGLLHS